MDENWKVIFTSNELHLSEITKQVLQENGIKSILLNKMDSAYPSIGYIEVLVREEDLQTAEQLLKELNTDF
jgi:hypothetical protein